MPEPIVLLHIYRSIGGVLAVIMSLLGCQPARPTPRAPLPVVAFCGINPDDATARLQLDAFVAAGIDAMMGACHRPPADYTLADPGERYGHPDEYQRLIELVQPTGMKVVVFDERIWSDDPGVRAGAYDQWAPLTPWIEAWDMGDEWGEVDWPLLEHRWQLVLDGVGQLGPPPYTNNLPWMLDAAWALHPRTLSYDSYDVPVSLALAGAWSSVHPNLMCAVNGLVHGTNTTTPATLKATMKAHRAVGCDSILLFGGTQPIDTPGFETPSLVNPDGTPTAFVAAVRAGAA